MKRIGVLIMAYGTPSSPDDVEAYYTRIRHGRPPTPELLADLQRRYDAIGGTSPLNERTLEQVDAIREALEDLARGAFDVRYGSKYGAPLVEETAGSLRDDGYQTVIGLALAPHSSTMSTIEYMSRARDALGDGVELIPIGAWWKAPGFLELIARRVRATLETLAPERRDRAEVIFSAHSLPVKILERGDTYPEQLRQSAQRAAALAGVAAWDTAWQSAGRTADPWLGPDLLDVLRAKHAAGVTDVVSCPIGFVSDHLEVLYDIDVEAMGVARELGLHLVRTPSLNADPDFVSILAHVIRDAA
jgi:protoporphyrin/coproporphyrin ferrochelatase